MTKQLIIDRMITCVIVAAALIIALEYYFYRVHQGELRQEAQQYATKEGCTPLCPLSQF